MFPVPDLASLRTGSFFPLEKAILKQVTAIESWFRAQWNITRAPLMSSVDLRHAGFKLAPVDTNLFPAGFNNINPDFFPLCIQAIQSEMMDYYATCRKVIIIPENHTRNPFYLEHLSVLKMLFTQAGYDVRIGSVDVETPFYFETSQGEPLLIEPLVRFIDVLQLPDFDPCLVVLNNDLSTGIPSILEGIQQRISPDPALGWAHRLKSDHFNHYRAVAADFCEQIDLDPWLINPAFTAIEGVDFMAQHGLEQVAEAIDALLKQISEQYAQYGIQEKPFVAMKANNGTYGMSVMMVHDGKEVLQMNRKQRSHMSATKGGRKVDKLILQEGIYSSETMSTGFVAEPVVYMIGKFVVGGFYRVHKDKGVNDNLNAPGMHFEPLSFDLSCNTPRDDLDPAEYTNRFYTYGVVARLAALAAGREMAALGAKP